MPIRLSRAVLAAGASALAAGAVALSPVVHTASATPARPAAATTPASMKSDLDKILADPRLTDSQVGLEVRDAASGAVLYQHDANRRLLPASNAKLLTSSAAMDVLGPNYRFSTTVARSGRVIGHTLKGNLYLKGYGDPTAMAADYDQLAASVARSGVRRISGNLVADDTYFDSRRLAPFWSWDDEPYYYSAQTSALSISPNTDLDTGSILVHITPAKKVGQPPSLSLVPPNHYVHLVDHATTGAAGSASTADAVRRHGNNVIDVTGSIPLGGATAEAETTVWEPTQLVAAIFRDTLHRHGVSVGGPHTFYRATPSTGTTVVATHRSITLSALLVPFLKLSNNLHAEHLTKTMGRVVSNQGTWSAGTAAILGDLAKNGADTSVLSLYDGSGLGRADYLTNHQITTLLRAVRGKSWFSTWYRALPIAGNPDRLVGGTLRRRLVNTPAANNLHGKTGSLTGVSALSGYIKDGTGRQLVFSMIENNFVANDVTDLEDDVALELANYGKATALTVVPRSRSAVPAGAPRRTLECSWAKAC